MKSSSGIIAWQDVNNLAELRQALERMSQNALCQIDNECVSARLRLTLERRILTDGSEVYNLYIDDGVS